MSDLEFETRLRLRRIEDTRGAVERRVLAAPALEVRETSAAGIEVWGYAATYSSPYEVGNPERGGWVETIQPGACRRSLSENCDVVLNAGHGRNLSGLPIARTKSGTLRLEETDTGLLFEASLDPSDPDVQTLVPKLRRGDLDGASFAFKVTDDAFSDDGKQRLIRSVSLHGGDVSFVDYGANPAASGQLGRPEVARRKIEIPDHTTHARERLAQLRGGRVATPRAAQVADSPIDLDRYRARLAEIRASR